MARSWYEKKYRWLDVYVINRHKSNKDYIIFLLHNFAINNRYLYDRM